MATLEVLETIVKPLEIIKILLVVVNDRFSNDTFSSLTRMVYTKIKCINRKRM
jgi:hypothetical protein